MKILTLLLCGVLSTSAFAQPLPQNGYDVLIAAGKLILPGENGAPSTPDANLAPEENLRRQRLAVARNAPALKLLREALQQPIEAPLTKSYTDLLSKEYGRFRELARQLIQESEVRLADGDAVGAMNSRLDCMEMGAAITRRASLIGSSVGFALQYVGRSKIEKVATRLDAAQCRAALGRLRAIDARSATLFETLQNEKTETITLTLSQVNDPQFKADLSTPETRKRAGISEADAKRMLALTPEILTANMTRLFDAIIEREKLPYAQAKTVTLPAADDPFSALSRDMVFATPAMRFAYERNVAENRLLQSALELRALKLETGAYPATFATPLDPFSDGQPLVYKRDGDTYRLYSIGPDGRDDGGSEIQTIETDRETGAKTVTERPQT